MELMQYICACLCLREGHAVLPAREPGHLKPDLTLPRKPRRARPGLAPRHVLPPRSALAVLEPVLLPASLAVRIVLLGQARVVHARGVPQLARGVPQLARRRPRDAVQRKQRRGRAVSTATQPISRPSCPTRRSRRYDHVTGLLSVFVNAQSVTTFNYIPHQTKPVLTDLRQSLSFFSI